MKGMKGRILRKLKCIPHVGHLKEGRVLHLHAADGFLEDPEPPNPATGPVLRDLSSGEGIGDRSPFKPHAPAQLEGDEDAEPICDKENIRPAPPPTTLFRRPDLNSGTLFDPDFLAAFQEAVIDHIQTYDASRSKTQDSQEDNNLHKNEEPPSKIPRVEEDREEPLSDFEQRCPPGGNESVILYTTTLSGVRKTFEDCNSVRFLLSSLKILFYERDVSMHLGFREELWMVLGARVIPPRLFIRGRYIGGADEVLGLHERGSLRHLVQGLPPDRMGGMACDGCGGNRFLLCCDCGGSCKLYQEEDGGRDLFARCPRCNENGLVLCPLCC